MDGQYGLLRSLTLKIFLEKCPNFRLRDHVMKIVCLNEPSVSVKLGTFSNIKKITGKFCWHLSHKADTGGQEGRWEQRGQFRDPPDGRKDAGGRGGEAGGGRGGGQQSHGAEADQEVLRGVNSSKSPGQWLFIVYILLSIIFILRVTDT